MIKETIQLNNQQFSPNILSVFAFLELSASKTVLDRENTNQDDGVVVNILCH
jgi:hypothetical protein